LDAVHEPEVTARLLLAGDVMLGRGVAPIVAADPEGLFSDVRRVVRAADLAAVNVESPFTHRPHASANPYPLEADPTGADLLAAAGFDIASVANNHAGDAGRASVIDSVAAISGAGMNPIGGGGTLEEAWTPLVVDERGLRIAFLAMDGSGQGVTATATEAGIATWDPTLARTAVEQASLDADVVVVSLHGGVQYRSASDPLLTPIAEQLVAWGADIVWGHGPHVSQPVTQHDPDGDGRSSVIATSLGNFLFDQQTEETSNGLILEVLVDRDGVVAHRVGGKHHDDLRVHFTGWRAPMGDAALLAGGWWNLDRDVTTVDTTINPFDFTEGTVIDSSLSDLDGDGEMEILVSYRHPLRHKASDPLPPPPTDARGWSAHIGVLDADETPVWLSRRPPHAVAGVAGCEGAAAFAFSELDADRIIATGAGVWSGFGFVLGAELPGPGSIGCADVDGDGRLDPVVTDRPNRP
jgi:poly-gamma-glutamate synthesis protein (capsule biosynthesis protein)